MHEIDLVRLDLSADEIELITIALRHLEATLGREEADELTAVMALIAKLERPANR